jgi:uncharacterized protein (TIGR02147 family)
MSLSLFQYANYKSYLEDFEKKSYTGRGFRSALAREARCQNAYVSRVLSGDADFSLEQAESLNALLGHSKEEAGFFLLLVQEARAGTETLKAHFREQILQIQKARLVLKNRFPAGATLSEAHLAQYFSSWLYVAIHVLVSVPQYQTREALAEHLKLPLHRVSEIAEFLVSIGVIKFEGGRYRVGTQRIHFGSDSPYISKHHGHWRLQAMQTLDRETDRDLHYSSVVSLSQKDLVKIKELLIESIETAKKIVRDSKDETAACFSLDLFEI